MCVADRNGDVKVLLYQGYSCCYAESRSHLDRDITENRFPSFAGYRPTLERGPRVGPSEFEFAGCLTVLFFAAWTFYAESTRSSENRQSFSETKTESFAIMTRPRQNFHADCEAAINNQINMELRSISTAMTLPSRISRSTSSKHPKRRGSMPPSSWNTKTCEVDASSSEASISQLKMSGAILRRLSHQLLSSRSKSTRAFSSFTSSQANGTIPSSAISWRTPISRSR
ncbi:uncharacterized protein LOC100907502 isoform X3 [Galendromus occidentalis]|uniref:Uncharacterized protein LOC100907502 isoform X3 n=1 Tax=Galendromus occidentalis TaxID=34638 RepID=A0AAJ7L4I8_9ACAR|nr:uncharacterized protein LOC100907502 isoform X3 [Galendromus occidentalis]